MKLGGGWSLITRVIVPLLIPQPIVTAPKGTKNGIGDIHPLFFFVAPPRGNLMWGVGPVFFMPTASNRALGNGKGTRFNHVKLTPLRAGHPVPALIFD